SPPTLRPFPYTTLFRSDDSEGRHEVAQPVLLGKATRELATPDARGDELPQQLHEARPRPVDDLEGRREPHGATRSAQAAIELPVLTALDALVEEADLKQAVTLEGAEVRGLGRALLASDVVRCSAKAGA